MRMWNAEGETSPTEAGDGGGGVNVIRKVASALMCWMLNDIFLFILLFLVDIYGKG